MVDFGYREVLLYILAIVITFCIISGGIYEFKHIRKIVKFIKAKQQVVIEIHKIIKFANEKFKDVDETMVKRWIFNETLKVIDALSLNLTIEAINQLIESANEASDNSDNK